LKMSCPTDDAVDVTAEITTLTALAQIVNIQ
jgi:hypothetical protein